MKAVLFDVDGVLIHGYHARPELRQCWDVGLNEDFGMDRKHFTQNYILGPFIETVLVGKANLRETLDEYFATSYPEVNSDEFIAYWLEKDSCLNTDLLAVVEQLAEQPSLSLYIATNQFHERANYLMNELGLARLFKDIFHSAKVGATKPDSVFFEYVEAALALPPEQITFFDDTPAVVCAAQERGWNAIEFVTCAEASKQLQELLSCA